MFEDVENPIYRYYTPHDEENPTKPRVTVVGMYTDKNTLAIATARCSENDQFCRAKGRHIAQNRLDGGAWYGTYDVKEKLTSEEFINLAAPIAEEVAEDLTAVMKFFEHHKKEMAEVTT